MSDNKLISDAHAEREFLRNIYKDYSNETAALERYALTLAGVIWGWAGTNAHSHDEKLLFFAPALTTFLFGLRALSVYHLRELAKSYLKILPQPGGASEPSSWEFYADKNGLKFRAATSYLFWIGLQAVTLGVGVYFGIPK